MSQVDREHYHDKEQEDYAEDKGYNPPNGGFLSTFGLNSDSNIAENKAYDEGWDNARNQDS